MEVLVLLIADESANFDWVRMIVLNWEAIVVN